mmetsp:Transcript_41719/g.135285  ORF Transcript_41719/g.135285 Transcript_41719/m.135285 type:complete len:212 (-) Transcript_41719:393-1028(-)
MGARCKAVPRLHRDGAGGCAAVRAPSWRGGIGCDRCSRGRVRGTPGGRDVECSRRREWRGTTSDGVKDAAQAQAHPRTARAAADGSARRDTRPRARAPRSQRTAGQLRGVRRRLRCALGGVHAAPRSALVLCAQPPGSPPGCPARCSARLAGTLPSITRRARRARGQGVGGRQQARQCGRDAPRVVAGRRAGVQRRQRAGARALSRVRGRG